MVDAARGPQSSRKVREVVLLGSNISSLDRTSLSLWHFQQLAQQLPIYAREERDEDASEAGDDAKEEPDALDAKALNLDDHMSVAAIAFEDDDDDDNDEDDGKENTQNDAVVRAADATGSVLTLASRVAAVYKKYRCVICLDASPSTLSIDPATGKLFLDLLYESVELFVWGLLCKMELGNHPLKPEIHVSVMVQGALVQSLCVLIQGFILTAQNASTLLQTIRQRIQLIEDDWAAKAQETAFMDQPYAEDRRASLAWILQNAVFALNSLPQDAAPVLVLVTDGVVELFDAYSYDNLLMQLIRHDVQCHFLRIGGGNEPNASFGFVPDVDLLQFIADSSGGSVWDYWSLRDVCMGEPERSPVYVMNALQSACYVRTSSVHGVSIPVLKLEEIACCNIGGRGVMPMRPYRIWREKVHEYRIVAEVDRIVEARIREGFIINKIHTSEYVTRDTANRPVVSPRPSIESRESETVTSKVLIVFLLQWKQNVWLEYVVSTTRERTHGSRRNSSQSSKALNASFQARKPQMSTKLNEWYVKMNILAHSEFLRAFEESVQTNPGNPAMTASLSHPCGYGAPIFLHEFIRNVQDVDRVLLHLMTATASTSVTDGFGHNGGSSSNVMNSSRRQSSSHPVFSIIGELSPVLWHRWFFVERFELLCVIQNESFTDVVYRCDDNSSVGPSNAMSYSRSIGVSANMRSFLGGNALVLNGVDRIADRLASTLSKWSTQRLAKDLYLKFLSSPDKMLLQGKLSNVSQNMASSNSGMSGASRRKQRQSIAMQSSASSSTSHAGFVDDANQRTSLCFVRVEGRSKALCAIHVAFFSTTSMTRKQALDDLKTALIAGLNDIPPSPSVAVPSPTKVSKSVVLCHRLIGRLMVTHDTLMLHECEDDDNHSHDVNRGMRTIASCCGGSELELRSVFGAYMWHSNWKWRISNADALVSVMKRLHESRIAAGFWVLDWTFSDEEEHSSQIQSVVFGREILMEDENGHLKASLVQYAMRRVSDTCLLTSFWMEPQHGVVKRRLSANADKKDKFHWGLKHAVGHDVPLEEAESNIVHGDNNSSKSEGHDTSPLEHERRSMELEDDRLDPHASMYLGENDLLQLIRSYIFDCDRHFLSCLFTFDSIMSLRDNVEPLAQAGNSVVGSAWRVERREEASKGVILPPFSTERLLGISKRAAEHYLMYLENDSSSDAIGQRTSESSTKRQPKVSQANEHLYSMLESTVRGLSDCEVSWTDFEGEETLGCEAKLRRSIRDDHVHSGVNSQMPLWLKHCVRMAKTSMPLCSLSKGKCFAKLLNSSTIMLAFLPSLESIQVRRKVGEKDAGGAQIPSKSLTPTHISDRLTWPDDGTSSKHDLSTDTAAPVLRMSVSTDDIVLYQERRLSFREGYKSWRMGHFQGSRDEKPTYGPDFQQLRLASSPEDHALCADFSKQTEFGCDVHLLLEEANGSAGAGFFQIAFYECSLSQLTNEIAENTSTPPGDPSRAMLKQLFFCSPESKPSEDAGNGSGKSGRKKLTGPIQRKDSLAPSSSDIAKTTASRQFRKKIKRAHEHNFSRGVYIALREGSLVRQSDLIQALSSCIEVPVDLDISLLYRMIQVAVVNRDLQQALVGSNQAHDHREKLKKKLDSSFEGILTKVFSPIDGTKYYYYFGNESATLQDDMADTDYEHFVMEDEVVDGAQSQSPVDGDKPAGGEDPTLAQDESAALSTTEKPSLVKSVTIASPLQQGASSSLPELPPLPAGGRRNTIHNRPPPVITSGDMNNIEPPQSVEEDAEFNKEVAVATSSFSAPFFFRFECNEIGRPGDRQSATGIAQRTLGSKSVLDMRRDLMARNQSKLTHSLTDIRPEDFDASAGLFLASKATKESDITQVAESLEKSNQVRVALRLVILTLPSEQLFERSSGLSPHVPFDLDDAKQSSAPSRAHIFSTLPLFQRQVLKQLRKEIKEWCSVEVLAILRAANKITSPVASLVQKLFQDLPSNSLTKVRYPLRFVTSGHDTTIDPVKLFKAEFGTSGHVCLHECNGLYFVVDRSSDEASPDVHVTKIPFWAFFVVESDAVCLYLHHPDRLTTPSRDFDRLGILTRMHLTVTATCKKVNQFLLLLQLHETRTCTGLLIPTTSQQVSPRSPRRREPTSSFDQKEEKNASFFWPGQFQCDLKYSAFFKLHERLAPNIALNMLCTSALEQFQVHNRRHIFVYRDRGGHVFYMKISISNVASEPVRQERRRLSRMNSGSTSAPPSNSNVTGTVGILLEVFGVCDAGEEVTHELCRLLERKLDEATQLILMKLLARNSKFQLGPSDMLFVCPTGSKPAHTAEYELPPSLQDPHLLLRFLSQTLCLSPYIRLLVNSGLTRSQRDSVGNISRSARGSQLIATPVAPDRESEVPQFDPTMIHPVMFGHKPTLPFPNDVTLISPVAFTGEVKTLDDSAAAKVTAQDERVCEPLSFVLNLNPELRLSPGFMSRVGKGLALLRVEVGSHRGQTETKTLLDLPHFREPSSGGDSTRFTVRFSVWTRGTINSGELVQVLESSLEECVYDYAVERSLHEMRQKTLSAACDDHSQQQTEGEECAEQPKACIKREKLNEDVKHLWKLLDESQKLSAVTVTKLESGVGIAPWDIENVVKQLCSMLQCVPVHLRPQTFLKSGTSLEFLECEEPRTNRNRGDEQYKIVCRLEASRSPCDEKFPVPGSPLAHSDSIQSDLSDLESLSKFSLGSSFSMHDSLPPQLAQANQHSTAKEFSEPELQLHQSSSTAVPVVVGGESLHSTDVSLRRSFYYAMEVSTSGGFVMYGYNMSAGFVDTILVHVARILTWSRMRDSFLRSLLMEKSGLTAASPAGCHVIQPRDLLRSTGNTLGKMAYAPSKDSSVRFVDFWRPFIPILCDNPMLPKALDSAHLRAIHGTALAKYLREANTVALDGADHGRPRARSNVSLHGAATTTQGVPPDLSRDASQSSTQRTAHGDPTAPLLKGVSSRAMALASSKSDIVVPSPTKRPSGSNVFTPGGGAGIGPGGGGLAMASRLRNNASAANALLAARARARGGGLPQRMGPGISSSQSNANGNGRPGDTVAPWDMPIPAMTKNPSTDSTQKAEGSKPTLAASSSSSSLVGAGGGTGSMSRSSSGDSGRHLDASDLRRTGKKSSNTSLRDPTSPLQSPVGHIGTGFSGSQGRPTAVSSASSLQSLASNSTWRQQLENSWSPRFLYNECSPARLDSKETPQSANARMSVRLNPLKHFTEKYQARWNKYESKSTCHAVCVNLFNRLTAVSPNEEADEPVSLDVIDQIIKAGHTLRYQRYRIAFIERWEVVKLEEEYLEEGAREAMLESLKASMDLVNLLSYKKEFVFLGNDFSIARLYIEHTIQGMCGKEGDAVREMKKQIMKNIFHQRLEVAHEFYERYAVHLRSLGFRHIQIVAADLGRRLSNRFSESSHDSTKLTAMDTVAAEDESFTEYFCFSGNSLGPSRGWKAAMAAKKLLLVLKLKCDHHGVLIKVVLVSERDLHQHNVGFQSGLVHRQQASEEDVGGQVVTEIREWLDRTLRSRMIIYDFNIRFFQRYLRTWSELDKMRATSHRPLTSEAANANQRTFQNMIKGVRCFLYSFPEPPIPEGKTGASGPDSMQQRDCVLRTAVVDLPPCHLHSNCAESILMKILLRYIAAHAARYEVLDIMQYGTPDTLVTHSPTGRFFNRLNPLQSGSAAKRKEDTGYSLLITMQSLSPTSSLAIPSRETKRNNSIRLILLKSTPSSLGIGNGVLPVERALMEAELFVQELFRVAADHYERDLLWSRLLYADSRGLAKEVASLLDLPAEHFHVEVGPQQLEECLRLSVCTSLETMDPSLSELLTVPGVPWQELVFRIRDVYVDQVREYQFNGEEACHLLLLCPKARDLMIHLTFKPGIASDGEPSIDQLSHGRVLIEICHREEPRNQKLTFPQRRVITDFVNSIVHWLWRSLLYD